MELVHSLSFQDNPHFEIGSFNTVTIEYQTTSHTAQQTQNVEPMAG